MFTEGKYCQYKLIEDVPNNLDVSQAEHLEIFSKGRGFVEVKDLV